MFLSNITLTLFHTRPPLEDFPILTKTVYRGRDFHTFDISKIKDLILWTS
jgi:hypothetical protein